MIASKEFAEAVDTTGTAWDEAAAVGSPRAGVGRKSKCVETACPAADSTKLHGLSPRPCLFVEVGHERKRRSTLCGSRGTGVSDEEMQDEETTASSCTFSAGSPRLATSTSPLSRTSSSPEVVATTKSAPTSKTELVSSSEASRSREAIASRPKRHTLNSQDTLDHVFETSQFFSGLQVWDLLCAVRSPSISLFYEVRCKFDCLWPALPG